MHFHLLWEGGGKEIPCSQSKVRSPMKSGKNIHLRIPITNETVKPLVKAYYDVKGQWKGVFTMQRVEKIRIEKINQNKVVAHISYIYQCVVKKGCGNQPNVGKDQRRFWLVFDGNKWRVTKMGEYMSAQF